MIVAERVMAKSLRNTSWCAELARLCGTQSFYLDHRDNNEAGHLQFCSIHFDDPPLGV
jgi:hypothetical protein